MSRKSEAKLFSQSRPESSPTAPFEQKCSRKDFSKTDSVGFPLFLRFPPLGFFAPGRAAFAARKGL